MVLGMLTEPAGLFDEGLREEANGTFRILNAPGESANPEIEASQAEDIEAVHRVSSRAGSSSPMPSRAMGTMPSI